jgi:hypothetical protein
LCPRQRYWMACVTSDICTRIRRSPRFMKSDIPNSRDQQFVDEFTGTLTTAFDKVTVNVFLCGKGLPAVGTRKSGRRDLRSFLRTKLERELKNCRVKLGEHQGLIRIYRGVAGNAAFNLADHEITLAKTTDLLVIFPCSPGSFAELGMFCLEDSIAPKMAIFLNSRFRKSRGYIVDGPVAAAGIRLSKIIIVDYADRAAVWEKVKDLVLIQRAIKGKQKLFSS